MKPALLFAAGDARVLITSDQAEVLEAARSMFPELVATHRDRPTTQILVDREASGGYTMGQLGTTPLRLEWSALVNQLEHMVAEHLMAGRRDCVHLHAGGANLDGTGVLLLGPSGSGKSTTSVQFLVNGTPILGDDVVLAGRGGLAEPFYRRPKIDTKQAVRFGVDPLRTVLWQPGSDECWLDPTLWAGWSAPVPVKVIACVRYVPDSEVRTETIEQTQLLSELLAAVFPGPAGRSKPEEVATTLVELAGGAVGFRLTYGRSADAVEALARAVDAPNPG